LNLDPSKQLISLTEHGVNITDSEAENLKINKL
jgi:hypothetical protein